MLDRNICLLIAAIAPEMLVFIAFCEWFQARQAMQAPETLPTGWTMMHQHYADMGGYCLQWRTPEGAKCGFLSSEQIAVFIRLNDLSPSVLLSKHEIEDKGKADWFVKAAAILQALWLVLQCVARAAQGLAVSTLEMSTLAYIPCAIVIFYFWGSKPYDVQTPTILSLPHLKRTAAGKKGLSDTGTDDGEASNAVMQTLVINYVRFPMVDKCVASVQNALLRVKAFSQVSVLTGVFYLIFGGLHCAAWNFTFPSPTERLLWRICSLVLTFSIPVTWILTRALMIILEGGISRNVRYGSEEKVKIKLPLWLTFGKEVKFGGVEAIQILGMVIYVLARLYMLGEVFASLRSLPSSCFESVNWNVYLPHV